MDPMSKLRSNFKSPSFLRPASRSKPVMPASNSTLAGPPPPKRRRTDDQPGPRQDADDTIVQRGEDEEWELPNQAALVNRAPVERAPSGSLAASRAPFGPTGNSIPSRAPSGSGVSSEEDGPFYMCTWRKPQFKKHKTWDGDAVLVVKDGGIRCALKCVETGRDLASNAKFSAGKLRSGDELTVGGKEIEIDREIAAEDYKQGRPFATLAQSSALTGTASPSTFYAKPTPRTKPKSITTEMTPAGRTKIGLLNPGQGKLPHPRFDPSAEGAVVMKRPDEEHQKRFNKKGLPVVDVVIDPQLGRALRPHQIEGVKFLYEVVMGMRTNVHDCMGGILADEMGLGKTLQTITLILTLLRQNCYYTPASCTIERALIVCPLSLVKNWKREFRKWLGANSINVLCIDGEGRDSVERFVYSKTYQVLIIGYEKLRTCVQVLKDAQPPIGLIVCDEGHRLKSKDAKTTQMFEALSTPRRIILSGTPIQNDLSEFFAMVDFVNPGLLGTYNVFKKVFEDPIIKSRVQNCRKSDRELGQARSETLMKVTQSYILRRTADLLSKYLPPKYELVVFCSPTPLQIQIYRNILDSSFLRQVFRGDATNHLLLIGVLRKLCNTPELLLPILEGKDNEESAARVMLGKSVDLFPKKRIPSDVGLSGKLIAMCNLLKNIRDSTDDKVVIISNFTATLDIVQGICGRLRYSFVRLDGKTKQEDRIDIVNEFNRSSRTASFVFLLSAKSGGVGLNLIGANRLILLDSDWNPSTDRQAMARIHRDGQKKNCFIYRMLLTGTMDEKIYQRQISKIGLSDSLMDNAGSSGKSTDSFSTEELRNIFMLHTDTPCLTHDLLGCGCAGNGQGSHGAPDKPGGSDSKNKGDDGNSSDDELPGFVPASQHSQVENINKALQNKRAKLAMLHEWAHFDCTSPDKVRCLEDEMLQQVVTEASTTSKTNPATVAQPPHAGTEPENALSSEPAISSDADQTAGQKGAKKGTSKFLADFDIDALSSSWEEEAKSKLTKRGSRGQRMKPDPGEEMEGSSSDLEGRKGKGNGKGKGKGKGIGIGNAHLLGRDFDSREFRVEKVQPGSVLFVFGKMSSAPTAEVPELTTI